MSQHTYTTMDDEFVKVVQLSGDLQTYQILRCRPIDPRGIR